MKKAPLVNQSIEPDRFKKHWDLTLPEGEMILGLRA
jgi:hypothetical protein